MPQRIAEEDKVHAQWYEDARKVTADSLPVFVQHLTEDYSHDYGTICHAMAAAAIAAASAIDSGPQGGITGFQGGAVMWQFISNWSGDYKDKPLRLLNYADMLFPQYERKFRKTISAETHRWLVAEAAKMLADNESAASRVRAHWQQIADGAVPFGYVVAET